MRSVTKAMAWRDHRLITGCIEEYIQLAVRTASERLVLICPFIKIGPLARILTSVPVASKVTIITSWSVRNFATGVSDIAIFNFCQDRKVELRAHHNVHMKCWIIDQAGVVLTSANVTEKALGDGPTHNREFLVTHPYTDQVRRLLQEVFEESWAVDGKLHQETVAKLAVTPKIPEVEDDVLTPEVVFTVEDLPTAPNPSDLWRAYSGEAAASAEAERDLDRFGIPPGFDEELFHKALKRVFFSRPIVARLAQRIEKRPRYFGEMKELIQSIDGSDPAISRRDLTETTQNVYRWFAQLVPEQYETDQPHISQRITDLLAQEGALDEQ